MKNPTREIKQPAIKMSVKRFESKYHKRTPDDLAVAFMPLVKSMSAKYSNNPSVRDELESAGYVGLVMASKKYDHRRGTSFSKYSRFWIKKYMMECMTLYYHPVTISANKALEILQKKRNESIDAPEIEYKYFSMDNESLSTELRNELATQQRTDELPFHHIAKHESKTILDHLIRTKLNHKERNIIYRRIGMHKHFPHTLDELGAIYGVTREAIRMCLCRAFRKLQYPLQYEYEIVD